MKIRIEPRGQASIAAQYLTPVVAIVLTMALSSALFGLMGHPVGATFVAFFISPLQTMTGLTEIAVKGAPLLIIATGLALTFRAGLSNIGAEGQLIVGALAAGWVALACLDRTGGWILPLMAIAGIAGGAAWAAIPAYLRIRFNVSEILSSLMLTYVAALLLNLLVYGPWRDPEGMNFPQSRMFSDDELLPILIANTRLNVGAVVAIAIALGGWLLMSRSLLGFQIRAVGAAPAAARYAGFNANRIIYITFLTSGGLAGLAGMLEIAGPIGQIIPEIAPGYGFTAIIVAFLGRLHPLAIIGAAFVMAVSYIGGENAQVFIGLPKAVTGVVQGLLLFVLLASDFLVRFRIKVLISDGAAA